MLSLWVFMALETSVGIESFACLSSQFGWGIVALCCIASLLASPHRGHSGHALTVHGGMPY